MSESLQTVRLFTLTFKGMTMTDTELEALAYILGDSAAAELYKRIIDAQIENNALICEVEDLRSRVAQLERDAPCR